MLPDTVVGRDERRLVRLVCLVRLVRLLLLGCEFEEMESGEWSGVERRGEESRRGGGGGGGGGGGEREEKKLAGDRQGVDRTGKRGKDGRDGNGSRSNTRGWGVFFSPP